MPKSVNKCIILGFAGKDPEIKFSQSGTAIANLSVATSDRFKDKSGEWQDRTEWHSVLAFGRTAEIIRDYIVKGSQVYVEGRMQTSSWDDKQSGQKRYKTEIVVNDIVLIGGSKEKRGTQGRGDAIDSTYIDDSDVPF